MPHHFRTIEQFVQLLDTRAQLARDRAIMAKSKKASTIWHAEAEAYGEIASIVRTSNIGIVYPPPEPAQFHKSDLVQFYKSDSGAVYNRECSCEMCKAHFGQSHREPERKNDGICKECPDTGACLSHGCLGILESKS